MPDLLTAYLAKLRLDGASDSTLRSYRGDIVSLFRFADQHDPAKLTVEDFAAWDNDQRMRLSHNTRTRRRVAVSGFFAWLFVAHGIPDITADAPSLKRRESDPTLIYPDDIRAILHAQDEMDPVQARDGAIIAFLAATGVRRSEAVAIRMGHVMLASGGKHWVVEVPSVKPDQRSRRINFGNIESPDDIVTSHFGIYFTNRARILGGTPPDWRYVGRYPLFSPIIHVNRILNGNSFEECVKRACGRIDHPRMRLITCHTFRHYFATYCTAHGMPIELVRTYMGHASLSSTLKYVHLAEKATAEAMRKANPVQGVRAKSTLAGDLRAVIQAMVPRQP